MWEHVVVSLYVLALWRTVNLFGVYPTSCALSVGIRSCDSELDKWLREWMDGYLCSRFHRQDFPILVVFANAQWKSLVILSLPLRRELPLCFQWCHSKKNTPQTAILQTYLLNWAMPQMQSWYLHYISVMCETCSMYYTKTNKQKIQFTKLLLTNYECYS